MTSHDIELPETVTWTDGGEALFAPFFDVHGDDPDVGRTLAGYRLIRLVAHGGMGKVFLAERPDLERLVAFKLARRSLRGEARRWYQNEGKIHARLEHPNVARLYDAGTDDDGRPFFAIEFVDGEPIDTFCQDLDVEQRLRVVLKVCAALQYAHRQPIVHLDIKPSNILVGADGEPKLLDFGISQLLSDDGPGAGLESSAMTFQYASPEQLRAEPLSVSSDIYSLGVVLYKLLAGALPYQVPALADPEEIARMVCEMEPPAPSRSRGTLAGELDAIVLKALEKDPARRYLSVQELADDIERHLAHRPVRAFHGGPAYRLGRFVRRHRLGTAAAALFALLVLGAGTTVTVLWQRAERALVRAERASQFLEDLIKNAKPDASRGEDLTVRELLDRGRRRIPVDLEDEPELQMDMAGTFGEVLRDLGDNEASAELLAEALAVARRHHGGPDGQGDHPEIAKRLNNVGAAHLDQGRFADAEKHFREALAMGDRLGQSATALFRMKNNLASALLLQDRFDAAETLYLEVLDGRRRHATEDADANVSVSLRNLGSLYLTWGKPDEAEPYLREALDQRLRLYGANSTHTASVLDLLGGVALARQRFREADAFYLDTLRIRRQRLGDEHLWVARTQKSLAELILEELHSTGRSCADEPSDCATARLLLSRARKVYERSRAPAWEQAAAENVLGLFFLVSEKSVDAEPCLRASWERLRTVRGEGSVYASRARRRLAGLTDVKESSWERRAAPEARHR